MKNPIAKFWVARHAKILDRAIEQARREGRLEEFLKGIKKNGELQKFVLQPKRYETINGTGEIGWGTAMLCFAISSYAPVILPVSPWRGWIGFLFLAGACVAMPLALWASKRFVTWPRVGYVAFRRDRPWWIGVVVSTVAGGVISIALLLLLTPEWLHRTPASTPAVVTTFPDMPGWLDKLLIAGFGMVNAKLYLMFNAVSIKEHRWKWAGFALILAIPLTITFLGKGNYFELSRPVFLFQGSAYLLSGVMTLIWFLRHYQPPAAADPE